MVVDEAGPSPRGLCGLSLSHNMAAEAADTSVEAAPSPRSLPSPPRPGSSRRRFFTAEHSTRSSVGAYDPLPGEGESVAVALSVSPSEGENCIAAEREDVVPPVRCIFGGQLGPRLSSPEGAPTAYSYVIYGLLGGETVVMLFFGYDGRGILNKLGCERTSGCSSNDAVAAAEMALHLGAVALFAAGAFVFHSLRCVTRTAEAGGQLALLGVGTTQISASVARSLQRWRYLVRTMIWPLAMANLGQAALVALNPKYETAHRLFYFLMFFGCAMVSVTLGEWWLTLRLAVELTDHKTKPVVNAAKAAAEREVELDDAAWWFTIEEPAQKLAQETLPLLSDGWGPSLVAAMVGIGAIALGGFLHLSETPQHVWDDSGLVHRMMAGTVAFIASLPVLLALAPARISTACDELTDSLTDLHTKGDPVRQYERMVPLETILDRANRKNGIGFRIGRGTVLDKKALLLTAVKVYSLVATAVPLLLSALEMVPDDDPMCHHGWSRIDENCIKVFRTEPQTWPAAESVCGGYGGHLASIGSRTEHDAVLALMQSAAIGLAWIGLTDVVEESAFVWSDGAPHEYSQWAVRQPDERNEAGQCTTGNDCAAISSRGWEDYPCEVTGLPDKPGCYPHQLPFVCAKPALPVVASAGEMNGCLYGRWVIGTAHHNRSLGPTVAPGALNDSVYNQTIAAKDQVAGAVSSAAECMALVHSHFPEANAAEYSNLGGTRCDAVYKASGIIYDATVQTCMFDSARPPRNVGRRQASGRRLLATATELQPERNAAAASECESELIDEVAELKAAHADLKDEMVEMKAALQAKIEEGQEETRALLMKLLADSGH